MVALVGQSSAGAKGIFGNPNSKFSSRHESNCSNLLSQMINVSLKNGLENKANSIRLDLKFSQS